MRKAIGVILSLIVVGLTVWGGVALLKYDNENKDKVISRTYSGRILMTDSEWNSFKQILADNKDIMINSITELSSSNPLVIFTVTTNGETFPYGEQTGENHASNTAITVFFLVMISVAGLALVLFVIDKSGLTDG